MSLVYAPGSKGLLEPIAHWFHDPEVSEIMLNKPYEIFIEKNGLMQVDSIPVFSPYHVSNLFQLIANENGKILNSAHPIMSGSLYDGSRVQLVISPVCQDGVMSIRKKVKSCFSLNDYACTDFYSSIVTDCHNASHIKSASLNDQLLLRLYHARDWDSFIRHSILFKKNIIVSGGTSSGKTTFLQACLCSVPIHERIIILEDTREIELPHANQVSLLAQESDQCQSTVTMQQLIRCTLRLRPDRIIIGELRGKEVLDYIDACISGHPGSISSIHADSPRHALMRMVHLYKQNTLNAMTDHAIYQEISSAVDIIIQLIKSPQGRVVSSIYFKLAHNKTIESLLP